MILMFCGLIFLLVRVLNVEDHHGNADYSHIAQAIDGDSIKMFGKVLRLEGIDSAEYNQTCTRNGQGYLCGKIAHRHLKKLLQNSHNQIKCILKGEDKYRRTIAVCYPKNADENTLSINAEMVRAGWAIAFGRYYDLERDAQKHKRGLWAGEFIEPQVWRRSHND